MYRQNRSPHISLSLSDLAEECRHAVRPMHDIIYSLPSRNIDSLSGATASNEIVSTGTSVSDSTSILAVGVLEK